MGGGGPARGLLEHATEVGKNALGEEPRFSWEAPGGVDRASSGPAAHVLFPPQRLHEVWKDDDPDYRLPPRQHPEILREDFLFFWSSPLPVKVMGLLQLTVPHPCGELSAPGAQFAVTVYFVLHHNLSLITKLP